MLSWIKQQRKLIKAGTFKSERMEMFEKLEKLFLPCKGTRKIAGQDSEMGAGPYFFKKNKLIDCYIDKNM